MKRKIRLTYIFFVLTVCVMSVCLSGCKKKINITTGVSSSELLKADGEPCSMGLGMLVLMTEKTEYEKYLGDSVWQIDKSLEGDLLEKVKQQLAELTLIEKLATKNNISLKKSEKENVEKAATEFYDTLADSVREKLDIEKKDVEDLYTKFLISHKFYESITDSLDIEVSDEEARVLDIMYIYAKGKDKEALEKINKAYGEVIGGKDFKTVAEEFSDDDVIRMYYSRGKIDENFQESAYNLKEGDVSNIINTENGYYIIYCNSAYVKDRTETNKLNIIRNRKREEYMKIYAPYKSQASIEYNSNWDKTKLENYKDIKIENLYDVYSEQIEKASQ